MRAWTYSQAGAPSQVLTLSTDIPVPQLKNPDDILIRISYAAINPGVIIMMQLTPFIFRHSPAIPELDFAGTVVATQSENPQLRPGTEVFGSISVSSHIRSGIGSLGEYIVVPISIVARKPSNATLESSAGLAVTGCTALLLIEKAGLETGNRVLVNGASGASGGVGWLVIQIAKHVVGESGKVVAICSERNHRVVKELGADEVNSTFQRLHNK
jgi:NADPH:quinone reductase-like Zn-dependent oxidoreductase